MNSKTKQQGKTARPEVSDMPNDLKIKLLSEYLSMFPPAFRIERIGKAQTVWAYHSSKGKFAAVCYSYSRPVAVLLNLRGTKVLFIETSRSCTTARHISRFLGYSVKEVTKQQDLFMVYLVEGLWRAFDAIC